MRHGITYYVYIDWYLAYMVDSDQTVAFLGQHILVAFVVDSASTCHLEFVQLPEGRKIHRCGGYLYGLERRDSQGPVAYLATGPGNSSPVGY